jgi:NADH-quinone oxidoreductase subunit A
MLSQASESFYESYGVVLAVAVGGALLVGVAFTAARLVAPRRPLPAKLTTYECGMDPVGEGWSQTQVRYFLYAFLFVIFDVESVFLFPWAVIFEGLGYTAVVEMAIFIGILAVGLLYAWRKGVLRWEGQQVIRTTGIRTPRGFTRVPGGIPAGRGQAPAHTSGN